MMQVVKIKRNTAAQPQQPAPEADKAKMAQAMKKFLQRKAQREES